MAPKNRRSRVQRRLPLSKRLVATQGDRPSFAGQQISILDLPGDTQLLSSAAGGTLAFTKQLNASTIIGSFHAFYDSVFQEYRIRKIKINVHPVSGFAGITMFRFDEKSNVAPTLPDMESSTSFLACNTASNPKSVFTMNWTPRDLFDLDFIPISIDNTVCNLKIYTDSANLASPASSTFLWVLRPVITVEFRGVGGV